MVMIVVDSRSGGRMLLTTGARFTISMLVLQVDFLFLESYFPSGRSMETVFHMLTLCELFVVKKVFIM